MNTLNPNKLVKPNSVLTRRSILNRLIIRLNLRNFKCLSCFYYNLHLSIKIHIQTMGAS
jgi:hypothetical protein